MISNSHLDHLYPIPGFATGGAIGNALFFMLSGYGLTMSWQKTHRSFSRWYGRRILRIYPSLYIVILCSVLFWGGAWHYWTVRDYFSAFIWPTPAWFISALMIFYVIFFVILKLKSDKAFLATIVLLFIPYVYFYITSVDLTRYAIEGPGYFKWIFYLQIMLFGGYLASNSNSIFYKGKGSIFSLLAALILYLICGVSFVKGQFTEYQFVIHLLTFAIVCFAFIFARSAFVVEKIMGNKKLSMVVAFIAGLTLEIYLMQYYVYSSKFVTSLVFPLNVIIFWIAVIFISFGISKAGSLIRVIIPGKI